MVKTAATRLMGCKDRIALDMLLAEMGRGVCEVSSQNNTAPDGSVTKALAENSGVDNALTKLFDSVFGK